MVLPSELPLQWVVGLEQKLPVGQILPTGRSGGLRVDYCKPFDCTYTVHAMHSQDMHGQQALYLGIVHLLAHPCKY